ncbi:MAG TPA: alpha/beta hydrolase [Dehalococcoidia bacterium]
MDWQQSDVELDGVGIHYYRRGSGRPLIMAHGFGDNGRCWTHVAKALENGFDIVAYDARSHGRSDDAPGPPDPSDSDIIKLSGALGMDRPVLLGHSMGAGSVAAAAAARPELFACAVLEDPGWRTEAQAAQPRPARRDFTSLSEAQLIEEARKFGWHEDELQPWAESKKQLRATTLPSTTSPAPDAWKNIVRRLASLPTLLITGENARGSIVSAETAAEAQRLNPRLEVANIAGAGHNIRRDAFEPFMAAVRSFVERHAASATL